MGRLGQFVFWCVAAILAVTTTCAPACTQFAPVQDVCPVHHAHDCCKHNPSHNDDAGSTIASIDSVNLKAWHEAPVQNAASSTDLNSGLSLALPTKMILAESPLLQNETPPAPFRVLRI